MLTKYKQYIPYLTAFVLVSCICGFVYTLVQQDLRQGANDPQIELAENSSKALAKVQNIDVGTGKVDIANSLSPYIIVVDKDKKVLATSAILDGQAPTPPAGIFDTAKKRGLYSVTWQPRPGVRQALAIVPVPNDKGQFVAVGRSLREVEKRIDRVFLMTAAAWGIMLVVSFAAIFAYNYKPEPKPAVETARANDELPKI
jgi:hypothetical protein